MPNVLLLHDSSLYVMSRILSSHLLIRGRKTSPPMNTDMLLRTVLFLFLLFFIHEKGEKSFLSASVDHYLCSGITKRANWQYHYIGWNGQKAQKEKRKLHICICIAIVPFLSVFSVCISEDIFFSFIDNLPFFSLSAIAINICSSYHKLSFSTRLTFSPFLNTKSDG
jgi:hypothetical protein